MYTLVWCQCKLFVGLSLSTEHGVWIYISGIQLKRKHLRRDAVPTLFNLSQKETKKSSRKRLAPIDECAVPREIFKGMLYTNSSNYNFLASIVWLIASLVVYVIPLAHFDDICELAVKFCLPKRL